VTNGSGVLTAIRERGKRVKFLNALWRNKEQVNLKPEIRAKGGTSRGRGRRRLALGVRKEGCKEEGHRYQQQQGKIYKCGDETEKRKVHKYDIAGEDREGKGELTQREFFWTFASTALTCGQGGSVRRGRTARLFRLHTIRKGAYQWPSSAGL